MRPNPRQVIITTEDHPHSVHGLSVHHRDFPEVRGEGGSPEDAAARLIELLSRALDSAPSDWRREHIERAIEDVRAFAKRGRSKSAGGRSAIPRPGADSRG
jgi:hypothetical protein